MRLLLDTQVALWWLVGSPRLSRSCRDLIANSSCVVSVASIWEVAIKHRLGKLPISPQLFRDETEIPAPRFSPSPMSTPSRPPRFHLDTRIPLTASCWPRHRLSTSCC